MGEYPPHPQKKCGFIAASPGQRASGVSLPHHTIISWDLSTEKYGLETKRQRKRGRAKDRDDGADTKWQHEEMRKTQWEDADNKLHIVFH